MAIVKSGVFISHDSREKSVALKLQEYLKERLGTGTPVFMSSDRDSIGGGRVWFNRIRESLKTAKVVIVLLSPASQNKDWILFEAGVGDGAEACVIPVVFDGLSFTALGFPLKAFHGRQLEELDGIVSDITREFGWPADPPPSPIPNFASEIAALKAADLEASMARKAAAAKTPVDDARETQKAGHAPEIIMEKRFLDLRFVWPHPAGLNGGPVFLARKHWQDKDPSAPLFSIQNFGQSPVLEVTVVFELDDNNADLSVPIGWQPYGLSNWATPPMAGKDGIPSLMYRRPGGTGASLPLYRRWAIELPNLSPSSPREIEFPEHIANRLFLRGLQRWALHGAAADQELTLWARITCHSMDGEQHTVAFCWGVNPFSHGETNPIVVYCHCRELALRGKAPEPPIV